ncbi:LysR substrate-binding domain-containing protein [Bradyrhizobium sp. Arg237L]|uniref:LysR substrate-binding domain-containing protein n=1 Tax=Bradyrhizobium sp. Arg237L TaxID=3003352 RepID=UPI00249E9728|nr:LysR substrate-binding domain-containing protein [Bradyrhizobium sp. Arg237L]MDI4238755.1 LysR substrate-binding domain-containing protein [Bradyrhizobium sp. Arg237L]
MIAVSDFVTALMLPGLFRLLRREAPLIDLEVRSNSCNDLAKQIDLGQVDVAIGAFSEVPEHFMSNSLFRYDDVLIASSSRDLGSLSLEKLSGLSIAVVELHGELECGLVRRSKVYDRNALEQAYADPDKALASRFHWRTFLRSPLCLRTRN